MNIVFDLGGVVVTWEPDALIARAFPEPRAQVTVRREVLEHPDWVELDRGTLSRQEAASRAADRTGLSAVDVARFLQQVPASLVAIPETVDLLYRLRARGHTLFCLSNMQVPAIAHLENEYAFWEVFEGVVISCRVQLCKPEPEIYAHLLETYGLDRRDTVFIDDTAVNLAAAEGFGIRTIRFESPSQCERQLQALGCI